MSKMTPLEDFIFASLANVPELFLWTSGAIVKKRENTGHGFYTTLIPLPLIRPAPKSRLFDLPNLDIGVGDHSVLMGFILWFEEGQDLCLEGYQYAGSIDLKDYDLADLRPVTRSV